MKYNAVVLAARLALILFAPRKGAIPRRVRVTVWQTHSWKKKIVKVQTRPHLGEETQTMRRRFRRTPTI